MKGSNICTSVVMNTTQSYQPIYIKVNYVGELNPISACVKGVFVLLNGAILECGRWYGLVVVLLLLA